MLHLYIPCYYPSLTFCHTNPFIQEAITHENENLTIIDYQRFLAGGKNSHYRNVFDPEHLFDEDLIQKIDYDEVTFDMKDALKYAVLHFLSNDLSDEDYVSYSIINGSLTPNVEIVKQKYRNLPEMKYYVSARHFLYKCFTFDAPFVQGMVLSELELTISASVFKDGKVTSSSPNGEYFITASQFFV